MASTRQDSSPKHPRSPRYAPCVEEAGLGDAFRNRGLKPTIPSQEAGTLSTTADSNTVRENGILNSGHVDGNAVTGDPGARIENPNQDNHTYRFENPGSVTINYQWEKKTNIQSEHNIIGGHASNQDDLPSASSHAVASKSHLQATMSSESSILRTMVESPGTDDSRPSIRSSETHPEHLHPSESPSEGESKCGDQISTPEQYSIRIEEMGAKAVQSYEKACRVLTHVRRVKDRNELRERVNNHKHLFETHLSMLTGSIRQISCKPEQQTFLHGDYSDVVKTLTSLQKQLDRPSSFTETHLANEGEVIPPEFELRSCFGG